MMFEWWVLLGARHSRAAKRAETLQLEFFLDWIYGICLWATELNDGTITQYKTGILR